MGGSAAASIAAGLVSSRMALSSPSRLGSLANKIRELLARRFPRDEDEERRQQKERQCKKRQPGGDRIEGCNPPDDRRRQRAGRAAEGEGGADGGPADLGREQLDVVAEAGAV